ncbi:MAG: FAD-binding oxidoreductase [Granulosicoccaceae bacterium]
MSQSIIVLGAGSIGVATATHLLQRGWDVTMVDREPPASETSYGNAGVINAASFVPLNNPGLHASLAKYLRNNTAQLRYNWPYILKNIPWALQFLQSSKTRASRISCDALHQLTTPALDEHKAMMQRAGNMHRLSEKGWLKVYRKGAGYNEQSFEAQLYAEHGIDIQTLDAAGIHDLEPSLRQIYSAGYLVSGAACINNPSALIKEYAEQFVKDGGKLLQENVSSLSFNANQTHCHLENGKRLSSDQLVVAAGPWSGDILATTGYTVPMRFERGYHAHYHFADGETLGRSVHDIDSGFIMSPMEQGLRITTGVELNHRDAPPNYSQLAQVMPAVHEAIGITERTDDPLWCGSRPTFPDSRPVIGPAPSQPGLWVAFGHHHIGVMTGPITGKALAEQISNEPLCMDMKPFSPARYIRRKRGSGSSGAAN